MPAPGDPLIGVKIGARYRIRRRIGEGAMGAVYEAEQLGLGREVAIKVLKREASWSSDTVARFRREATATSVLTSPHTVRVFDFGTTEDGVLYLVMELLQGHLCSHRMEHGERPIGVAEALVWTQEVLRSLAEAHEKGIIHRDIKPDNLFLTDNTDDGVPSVKVLDFGIAKAIQGDHRVDQFETQDGTVFGTPRYMSPEQAQGKALDHRSDLYAVGVLLYELLTGAPPFVDQDAVIVMARHIREPAKAISAAAPGRRFPKGLEKVVERALHKRPDQRFQNAAEFDAALQPFLREARRIDRGKRPGMPKLALAALAVATGLFGAALVFWAWPEGSGEAAAVAANQPLAAVGPAAETEQRPAEKATVSLTATPETVRVFADGKLLGRTPLAVELDEDGTRAVAVRARGYRKRILKLDGQARQVHVVLSKLPPKRKARKRRPAETKAAVSHKRRTATKKSSASTQSAARKRKSSSPYEKF